jgi:Rho-binding antiterminator
MSDDQTYTPIDCGVYSEYELAIMHRRRLYLHWQGDDGANHIESVMPKDLKTEEKREYLIAERQDGSTLKLRLDRIQKAAVADI